MKTVDGRAVRAAAAAVLLSTLAVAAGAGGWAGFLQVTGNIHEVEAGSVFRSAQLDPAQLTRLLQEKGIKTVINLRGPNPGSTWYVQEIAATEAAGAKHVSLPMSANSEPTEAVLRDLVAVLQYSEKPMLIHCQGGADRSGLASALYESLIMHRPAEIAVSQLSFRYGHFRWLTSRTAAMDRTYWRIAAHPEELVGSGPERAR